MKAQEKAWNQQDVGDSASGRSEPQTQEEASEQVGSDSDNGDGEEPNEGGRQVYAEDREAAPYTELEPPELKAGRAHVEPPTTPRRARGSARQPLTLPSGVRLPGLLRVVLAAESSQGRDSCFLKPSRTRAPQPPRTQGSGRAALQSDTE